MFSFEDFKQRLEEAKNLKKENAKNPELYNQRHKRYGGLMDNVDYDLSAELQFAHFAVAVGEKAITAFIFGDETVCEQFVNTSPGYEMMGFEGFKKATGDEWRNPDHYAVLDEHHEGIFRCII